MKKIMLEENEMPGKWYNIQADIELQPPLNPATLEPLKPEQLESIFPKELIKQEISRERWITIPEEIKEIYRIWRPTPMIRATHLEKFLKTPAKIYYKWEGVSPPGSHKPNTAVAQAYYNATITKARADAEAFRIRNEQLTPMLIQYLWLQKWNGNLPNFLSGSCNSVMPVLPINGTVR